MDITITLSLNEDGLLLATADLHEKEVGTTGDNNAQTLTFERGTLAGDLQLSFLTNNNWQTVDIGTADTYTIPNSLTAARSLVLSAALVDGDTVISGANRLTFFYRPGGDASGAAPSTIDSEWANIKNNAMLTITYDVDGNGVIDADALPLSSAVDSDSAETAATSAAVKKAYDLAGSPDLSEVGTVTNKSDYFGATALPGGLKMCWGYATVPAGTANAPSSIAITFPTVFTATPNVQVTGISTAPGTVLSGATCQSVTTTGCTIYSTRVTAGAQGITWFAIGY